VEANGASFYIEEHGEGVPILLVHGGFASTKLYDAMIPLLAPHARVITFDDRGHGHSTNPSGELSYQLTADDAAALIEALDLDRPFVGGWSDGGQVALELGMRHPGVARGLIIGGADIDFQSSAAQEIHRGIVRADSDGTIDFEVFEQEASTLASLLRSFHPGGEEQTRWVIQQTLTMWLEYPDLTEERVSQVTTPSIVIHADRDDLIRLDAPLQLFAWLPNAELAILPGCSHVRPLFEPATFVAVLLDFVQRHQGG
jgi:pimeloyl-ACP methyl ester carboxylesterase